MFEKAHARLVAFAAITNRSRGREAMEEFLIAGRIAGITTRTSVSPAGAGSTLTSVVRRTEQPVLASCPGLGTGVKSFVALVIASVATRAWIAATTTDTARADIGRCAELTIIARSDVGLRDTCSRGVTNLIGADIAVGRTCGSGSFKRAICGTAIAGVGVPVVALLPRSHLAVSTDRCRCVLVAVDPGKG